MFRLLGRPRSSRSGSGQALLVCDIVLWGRGCCRLPVTILHSRNALPMVQVGVWLKNRLARAKRDAKVRTMVV